MLHAPRIEPERELGPPGQRSARALFRRMTRIYVMASLAAIAILLPLIATGLEFQTWQWVNLFRFVPVGFAIYVTADILVIRHHLRPVTDALKLLDAGTMPDRAVLTTGITRALNLPFFAFMRVTFLHGPLATLVVSGAMLIANHFGLMFATWQIVAFGGAAMLFASPTHAIFEYFAVSRDIEGAIKRLGRALGGPLPAECHGQLIAIRLKEKLLYLAVAVASLPLTFFAVSVVFKIDRLFVVNGLHPSSAQLLPFYLWIAGVVMVCVLGSFAMALLTASEVSRSAARMLNAMGMVEKGRLDDAHLDVISTDEYAQLFRGFGLMVDSLREEQKILSVSQDLAGELQLDVLIARIMTATAELLGAERSTLFIHDPRTNELVSVFAAGLELREIRIPAGQGIAGAVFSSGVLESIADPYADPRFDQAVDTRTGFRTRNILCAPIANKAGGRIGVTQVLNKREGDFTAKDEARLRAFAAQVAVSLENARLFDDVLSMKNYNDSILKSTSNAIITLDSEERLVTVNDPGTELLGYARERLVGRSATQIAGENEWIVTAVRRTAETGERSLAVDAEMRFRDGRKATVNLTVTPLIDAADQRIGSMVVIEDVTEERRVRATMARYMSKEVADQLLEAGEIELVGKDQEVSVLFSDVRGFTTISEALGARETVQLLNGYFTEMVDVIFDHGGILDKYIGDAIMALFGAPFPTDRDADNAIAVANAMMLRLAELNQRRAGSTLPALDIGVGIATGDVIVGNIGSIRRMEYTVIGDSVNLASRLEGANKAFGTKILIGETTVKRLKSPTLLREIDRVRVKGKDNPVSVFEALGWRTGEPGLEVLLDRYTAGFAAYRAQDWARAVTAFEAALAIDPRDTPSEIYLGRSRAYAAAPPPADWDGVWTMLTK
ncbi:adenylate/guanylate cyclase domain-containing protein [Novosphingobium lentum]|uniref:adenylate/guanylate cyclase domain-containing protein n=1 Tax=Novosphingobium lentum TaxID=145287 RepID=UPI00082A6653|nr:adenylate/guanylate cyclase domain-containing protein [Novosphingobium lentum]